MERKWKRLNYRGKDLGDFYLVSKDGEIKGVKTNKIRKKNINHEGYYFVSVSLGSRKIKPCIKIHIAVADTFIGYEAEKVINHLDGNKLNNNSENLEFCTYKENSQHASKLGLYRPRRSKIKNINTGKIYDSITSAGFDVNPKNKEGASKNINRALRNNGTAYGYKWEYILN